MNTEFWVVPQKAFFFPKMPEHLEYMQYCFMLQMIQETGDFYSDKISWEMARSSPFSGSLYTFNMHELCWVPKQEQKLRYTCQTVTTGYSGLQDVQLTNGERKLCVAEALGKKDSGEEKQFL